MSIKNVKKGKNTCISKKLCYNDSRKVEDIMKKKNLILAGILIISLFFSVEKNVVAASYISSSAPDSFVTNRAGRGYAGGALTNTSNDAVMANPSMSANATGRGNNIIDYHTSTGDKIFCIDRMTDYGPGETYTKSGETVDYGVVYIITHAQDYYNNKFNRKGSNPELEASWFTQVAIWKYQNANNFTSISMVQPNIVEEGITTTAGDYYTYSNNAVLLWALADGLVDEAKAHAGTDPSAFNNLAFNYDGTHTVDKENKTIRTGLVSIQNSGEISSFSLDLSKAPSGTKVYNESGSELTSLTDIPSAVRFYLIVPIDNPDNYSFDFNISAIAGYTYYNGYKYTNGAKQPVVLVTNDTKQITAALKIEGSHIEDTASSISKVMYITGLFILLCGVGIIYANVKPKKQKI